MKKTIIFSMKRILFVFLMMIGVMVTLYGIFVAQLKLSGVKEYIMFIPPNINLFQTHQSDKEVHDTLLDIDNIVKEKNINKVVDKSNLDHYGKGLADKCIQKTKMLFSE